MKQRNNQQAIRNLVGIALFAALAYGVTFVFRLPISFLTFDAKDAIITVAGFIYGPLASVAIAWIAALLEFITISSTGLYGFLMNGISSACFAGVAALLYKLMRTARGAVLSLVASVVAMTGVMLLMNLWITPFYMGVSVADVKALIPTLLLPFNLAKGCLNAALCILLYKPVITVMRRMRVIPPSRTPRSEAVTDADREAKPTFRLNRSSILLISVCVLLAVVAIVFFVLLKKG